MKLRYPTPGLKALSIVAGLTLAANVSLADLYTIAGFTFNDANSVTTAVVVEGNPYLNVHTAREFAGRSDIGVFHTRGFQGPRIYFYRERTIGRLVESYNNRERSRNEPLAVSLPGNADGPPWPNVDRCAIELTWNGQGLRNNPGADFVVYEAGKSECYSVAVKLAGSDVFTPARYHFAKEFDLQHNANSTAFDLSHFGLSEGDMITAVRIRNLFNSKASVGRDKVDNASGQGEVLYPGDPGYSSGYTLTGRTIGSDISLIGVADAKFGAHKKADEGGGREFATDSLDADIVFVVGLHDIEKLDAQPKELVVK